MAREPQLGRVFVGVWEISNLVWTIGDALRRAGYEVDTLVIDTPFASYYRDNRYDDHVPWPKGDRVYRAPVSRTRFNLRMARRLVQAIGRCDTFVFVWRYSFLPFQLDLPLLRLLGKQVVVFFCGDDVRFKPVQAELDRRSGGIWFPTKGEEGRGWMSWGRTFAEAFWSVKLAEKTGCRIVGSRDSATFQGRRYSNFLLPQGMLVSRPREPATNPLLVHAPSNLALKGTKEVEEAVASLEAEGARFRFSLVQGMSNDELHDVLRTADIVIDQPGVWISRFAVESMAAGALVVGGNRPEYWGPFPRSPVVQFERDAERLAAALHRLIADVDERRRLMRASYEFVQRVYSYEAFVHTLEDLIGGNYRYPLDPLPDQRRVVRSLLPGRLQRAAVRLIW